MAVAQLTQTRPLQGSHVVTKWASRAQLDIPPLKARRPNDSQSRHSLRSLVIVRACEAHSYITRLRAAGYCHRRRTIQHIFTSYRSEVSLTASKTPVGNSNTHFPLQSVTPLATLPVVSAHSSANKSPRVSLTRKKCVSSPSRATRSHEAPAPCFAQTTAEILALNTSSKPC